MSPPLQIPPRATSAHKGNFGRVLLVGGSRGMSGAIALSAIAALKSGAGLVSAAIPDRCLETVASFHPAVMTIPLMDNSSGQFHTGAVNDLNPRLANCSAVGCGPGMTDQSGPVALVHRLLQADHLPRVFDADSIHCLRHLDWLSDASAHGPLVLTPHPGEFAALTGVDSDDRDKQIERAIEIADSKQVTIVLKGGPTVVIGQGENWTNSTGNPGMATGGSGDVLTGVITSLLGQGMNPWDAARLGVWVHGRAGDLAAEQIGQAGVTAQEISAMIPHAILEVAVR